MQSSSDGSGEIMQTRVAPCLRPQNPILRMERVSYAIIFCIFLTSLFLAVGAAWRLRIEGPGQACLAGAFCMIANQVEVNIKNFGYK